MPEIESVSNEKFNHHELKQYFSSTLGWGWVYQSRIVFDFLMRASAHARSGVVLDAGAGHQRYKPFFSESTYIAQEHPVAGRENKGITQYDILCDVKKIPLTNDCVDVVLSTSSLEHIELPDQFFTEAFRVLKPGGALFINVPFVYHEHEIPFDFQRPTRFGLSAWYKRAGFESVEVDPSSSSTAAANHFFNYALAEDARLIFKGSFLGKLARFLFLLPSRLVGTLTAWIVDRGPHSSTSLPVGWVAVGIKPGVAKPVPSYKNPAQFIEANAELDEDQIIADGQIQPG